MEWQVAEIVKKLRAREKTADGRERSRADFASFLNDRDPKIDDKKDARYIRPGDIQRLETAGRNLNKQFLIFLKLVPLSLEAGLLQARDLLTKEQYERFRRHLENGKSLEAKTDQGREIKEKNKRSVR